MGMSINYRKNPRTTFGKTMGTRIIRKIYIGPFRLMRVNWAVRQVSFKYAPEIL